MITLQKISKNHVSVEAVPKSAVRIVKRYDDSFDVSSAHYFDNAYHDICEIDFDRLEELKDKLIKAGFECRIK